MNKELESLWIEVVIGKVKTVPWHLLGGSEENRENVSQDNGSQGEILMGDLQNAK
jgi:hypothetical protein